MSTKIKAKSNATKSEKQLKKSSYKKSAASKLMTKDAPPVHSKVPTELLANENKTQKTKTSTLDDVPIINCLTCGKIDYDRNACCTFCGSVLRFDKETKQIPDSFDAANDAQLGMAIERKNKLLEFDRTSAARSHVYDDQGDYFDNSTAMNWLDEEEKAGAEAMDEVRREANKRSGRQIKVSFDFAGRRVIEDVDNVTKEKAQVVFCSRNDSAKACADPTLTGHAQEIYMSIKQQFSEGKTSQTKARDGKVCLDRVQY